VLAPDPTAAGTPSRTGAGGAEAGAGLGDCAHAPWEPSTNRARAGEAIALQTRHDQAGGAIKTRPQSRLTRWLPALLRGRGSGAALEQRATGGEFRLPGHHGKTAELLGPASDPAIQKRILLGCVTAAKLLVRALTVGPPLGGGGSCTHAFTQIRGLERIARSPGRGCAARPRSLSLQSGLPGRKPERERSGRSCGNRQSGRHQHSRGGQRKAKEGPDHRTPGAAVAGAAWEPPHWKKRPKRPAMEGVLPKPVSV